MAEQMMQEAAGKAIPAGYQQTEVGVIPEDWSTPTINEITNNIIDYRGRTPKKLGMEWGGGNILALSAGNVKKGFIDYRAECYFGSDELYRKWMTSGHAQKDDIVFTMEAPLGNAALIPDEKRYILSQRTVLLQIAKSKINPKFIIQYFLSDLFQKYISDCATGSTAQGIKRATFEQMFVAVPLRLEEQTAIANVLSDSDALIDALEQLIAKKQAIKSATMQQLLTGRTRLPQFALREDGTPKGTKPSELGEIPEDWEVGAIGDSCRTYSGGTPSTSNKNFYGGGIKWITSSDLNQGVIHDVAGRITDAGLNGSSAKLVEAHTLLIALYGATAGVCAITRISAAINQAVLAIVPAEHNSEYLFYWFTRHKEVIIETYTQGGQPNLSGDIVRSIKLAFPPVNEQTAIATILSDMDAEIQALEQRLGKTLQIKQGMMQELLTGKTRLIKPSKEVIHE